MFPSGLFSASKQFSSLDDILNAIKGMKDDPLANAGTNVVISRGSISSMISYEVELNLIACELCMFLMK